MRWKGTFPLHACGTGAFRAWRISADPGDNSPSRGLSLALRFVVCLPDSDRLSARPSPADLAARVVDAAVTALFSWPPTGVDPPYVAGFARRHREHLVAHMRAGVDGGLKLEALHLSRAH